MREWDDRDEGRTERETKERGILIGRAIMELLRILVLKNSKVSTRMTPAMTLSISGEVA